MGNVFGYIDNVFGYVGLYICWTMIGMLIFFVKVPTIPYQVDMLRSVILIYIWPILFTKINPFMDGTENTRFIETTIDEKRLWPENHVQDVKDSG